MRENQEQYDVLIIGGGPIGLACGLEAKAAGLRYVIIEKGPLVNSLYNYPSNMTFFSTSERLEIGGVRLFPIARNPTGQKRWNTTAASRCQTGCTSGCLKRSGTFRGKKTFTR